VNSSKGKFLKKDWGKLFPNIATFILAWDYTKKGVGTTVFKGLKYFCFFGGKKHGQEKGAIT